MSFLESSSSIAGPCQAGEPGLEAGGERERERGKAGSREREYGILVWNVLDNGEIKLSAIIFPKILAICKYIHTKYSYQNRPKLKAIQLSGEDNIKCNTTKCGRGAIVAVSTKSRKNQQTFNSEKLPSSSYRNMCVY